MHYVVKIRNDSQVYLLLSSNFTVHFFPFSITSWNEWMLSENLFDMFDTRRPLQFWQSLDLVSLRLECRILIVRLVCF